MAYSVSYIYDIVDRYSAKLKKITKATADFEKRVESVQRHVGGLNQKLNSSRETFGRLGSRVANTSGRLNRLNGKLDQTGKALDRLDRRTERINRTTSKTRKGFGDLGNAAAAAGGVIGGAVMVRTFTDYETTMLMAKGTTKATAAEFKLLSERAKELGSKTQFAASQAAAGIEMLGRNGLTATQILNGAIDASLQMSAATGTDLANSANIATDVMFNFGKTAAELAPIVDRIAGVTLNSKFNIDDYRLALGQAGGAAGNFGVSLDDFNTSIAAVAPLFASGSDAGTAFKTFLLRLNPASKSAAAAMEALNLNFFDADGKMKGMNEIAGMLNKALSGLTEQQRLMATETIFGTDAMRIAIGLASKSEEQFKKLEDSIKGVSAQKLAEDRMSGLGGVLLRLSSVIENLTIAIFESGLADVIEDVGNRIIRLIYTVEKLNPEILKFIGIAGMLAVVLGPLIVGFGILAAAITAIMSPVGVVIAIIVGLAIAGIKLYKSNKNVKDAFHHLWKTLKKVRKVFEPLVSLWNKFFGDEADTSGWVDALAAGIKTLSIAIDLLTLPLRTIADIIDQIIKSGFVSVVNKGLSTLGGFVGIKEGLGPRLGGIEQAAVRKKTAEERLAFIRNTVGRNIAEATKGATAERQTVAATLNGSIKVSADNGSTVKRADMFTDMPGNLGLNLGGA
jgi:TP901 family phage tail tape measure protein